jgi:hypothetical protein
MAPRHLHFLHGAAGTSKPALEFDRNELREATQTADVGGAEARPARAVRQVPCFVVEALPRATI